MTDMFDQENDDWAEDDFLDELPDLPEDPFIFYGNEQVIQQLNTYISSNRLPHALMFCGEQGVGKFSLAQALAHSLLSSQPEITFKNDATLTRMQQGSHSDYLYLSAIKNDKGKQQNISVDQVRAIGGFLSKTPGESPLRVIIIDGAESMNTNASNALLKNLEEPPANTLIILISHNQANLLPTIRSRVQMLKFSPLSSDDCKAIIRSSDQASDIADEENIALISELVEGRPGLALEWLDAGAGDIYQQWLEVVGGSTDEKSQLARVAKFAGELTSNKQTMHSNMQIFSKLLLSFLKRAAFTQSFGNEQEKQAIEKWREQTDVRQMVDSWFLLKDQFSLVQGLHLEYNNALITILLRVVRGQPPLEIIQ